MQKFWGLAQAFLKKRAGIKQMPMVLGQSLTSGQKMP
jgi:hypothetical protein